MEFPKMQAVMDEAYKKFEPDMSLKGFYATLTKEETSVVFLGNLKYQVDNGGFLQWYDNGYHVGADALLSVLETLGTPEAKKVAGLVQRCVREMRTFESIRRTYSDEDDFDDSYPVLSVLDTEFYSVSDTLLSQVEETL